METTWVDTSLNLNVEPSVDIGKPLKEGFEEAACACLEREKIPPVMLVEELNRLTMENRKLNEILVIMSNKYNLLQNQVMNLMIKAETEQKVSRKRKAVDDANGITDCSSSDEEASKKPKETSKKKVSRFFVQADASDSSLIVKDGYHWRKYGQKVTRDNPSPRAYYKCSFAPSCPVKKKVQRSAQNPSLLVATYEGEHNHKNPSAAEFALGPINLCSPRPSDPASPLTLVPEDEATQKQLFVQQMVSSLTGDPNFTVALASAISRRLLELGHTD